MHCTKNRIYIMTESKTHTFIYSRKDISGLCVREITEVRIGTDEETLPELIEQFERYLKAAGFYFEGRHLELIDDETEEEE